MRSAKLALMKNVHLLIADLFLPRDFAAEVCADLALPALEKILARGRTDLAARPLHTKPFCTESLLCELFACPSVAPVSAAFDGLPEGCWLRADPVHVRLQREQVVLLPNPQISMDEARELCASLNEHFAGQDIEFFAPHPQRWYVRTDKLPSIATVPMSQASGRNIHGNLPTGSDARRWHQLFNEIQMLLFAHPLNGAREASGQMPVNSLWFWGNGAGALPAQNKYDRASSDEVLVEMLSASAKVAFSPWQKQWKNNAGDSLLVWTGLRCALQKGDFSQWRRALQDFETAYAQPLWQALQRGHIATLQVDVFGADSLAHTRLTRADTRAFWRRSKRLADYSRAQKD